MEIPDLGEVKVWGAFLLSYIAMLHPLRLFAVRGQSSYFCSCCRATSSPCGSSRSADNLFVSTRVVMLHHPLRLFKVRGQPFCCCPCCHTTSSPTALQGPWAIVLFLPVLARNICSLSGTPNRRDEGLPQLIVCTSRGTIYQSYSWSRASSEGLPPLDLEQHSYSSYS
jgi:hypothetical protein